MYKQNYFVFKYDGIQLKKNIRNEEFSGLGP